MKNLDGRVAAVTGAASGLGRAMALAFAREGMQLALADVDADGLERTAHEVRALGRAALARQVDVSRADAVDDFASAARAEFGAVHLVCNNAGVAPVGAAWEGNLTDWHWGLGVNLWGVIHGIRAFVPMLLAQGEGHVVNTASVAGLISVPGMAIYNVSKHAVVTLSETLRHDLRRRGAHVGVSVLCPAYVPTGIADSARNRPASLAPDAAPPTDAQRETQAMMARAVAAGRLSADDVAARVIEAVRADRFYVLTHERILAAVRARLDDVLEGRDPRDPLAL